MARPAEQRHHALQSDSFLLVGAVHHSCWGGLMSCLLLSSAVVSWPLQNLGPFTVFVPIDKAFRGTPVCWSRSSSLLVRWLPVPDVPFVSR